MITFQINSNDINAIEQLLQIAREKFNLQIKVFNEIEKKEEKETKWSKFAKKMDGLFTPEIIEHINKTHAEVRENFTSRIDNKI